MGPHDSPLRRDDFRDQDMSYKDFLGHSRAGRRAQGSRPSEQPASSESDSCELTSSTVMDAESPDQKETCTDRLSEQWTDDQFLMLARLLDVSPADAVKLHAKSNRVASSRRTLRAKMQIIQRMGFSDHLASLLISLSGAS